MTRLLRPLGSAAASGCSTLRRSQRRDALIALADKCRRDSGDSRRTARRRRRRTESLSPLFAASSATRYVVTMALSEIGSSTCHRSCGSSVATFGCDQDLAMVGLEAAWRPRSRRRARCSSWPRPARRNRSSRCSPARALARHERDHCARVDAAGQERADRHIADHVVAELPASARCDMRSVHSSSLTCRDNAGPAIPSNALTRQPSRSQISNDAGGNLLNAFENRVRRDRVAERQIVAHGCAVDLRGAAPPAASSDLISEANASRPLLDVIVDGLLSEAIAREDQALAAVVPQRDAVHALDVLDETCRRTPRTGAGCIRRRCRCLKVWPRRCRSLRSSRKL